MGRFELDLVTLKLVYHRLFTCSLVIKLLLASFAIAALPFLATDPSDGGNDSSLARSALPPSDLVSVVKDLMDRKFVSRTDRCLCIGPPAEAMAMLRVGVLTAVTENCEGMLRFGGDLFDFVLWNAVEHTEAPARVLQEMERVLRAGGFGAAMVGPVRAGGMGRAAAPVVSVLKVSEVVSVRAVNGSVPVVVAVVFRKRGGGVGERRKCP